MKKTIVCLIAITLLLSVFLTSCGFLGKTPEKESETKSEVLDGSEVEENSNKNETESETLEAEGDSDKNELGFGKQNYDNKDFQVLLNNIYPIFERDFYVSELNGNNLNRVIYARNTACEEYLGIKLQYILEPGDWKSGISAKVANQVLGGGCEYDMLAIAVNAGLNGGNIGIYQNIMEMEYIDFDHSWWIQDMIDQNSINGQLYFLAGDTCMTTYSSMGCVFANLGVADRYKIDVDFYELVNSGKWTVEQLFTLFRKVKDDSNIA